MPARCARGQETGIVPPDRNPDAEAWVMIGGGLLRSVAYRLGGLLDEADLAAIQQERMRWLIGEAVSGDPSQGPEGEHPGGDRKARLRVRQATSAVNARAGDADLALAEPSLQ